MAAGASEAGGGGRLPSAVGGDVVGFFGEGHPGSHPQSRFRARVRQEDGGAREDREAPGPLAFLREPRGRRRVV